jgi:putative transposase
MQCRLLKVSRSAYYDWLQNPNAGLSVQEQNLRNRIKASFKSSKETYGSRRIAAELRGEGLEIGRYRVRRVMKELGLQVKRKRRFVNTTDSKHSLPVAANVLDREFNPHRPNEAWAGDITYIWTREGWLYLSVLIDLFSRRVVGWGLSHRIDTQLTLDALRMAIGQRRPPAGLIHHTDRGSQYASLAYQAAMARMGMVPSMSRKGNCWDNAVVERFFSSLKREWISDRFFWTRSQAAATVKDYILMHYNPVRLHSTLGYMSPNDFENKARQARAA